MKSKYKFFTITLLCTIIGLFSCTKNLDISPVSQITNESFWKTKDDAEGALTAAYVKLRSLASVNLFIWGEARSEVMGYTGAGGTLNFDLYYNNTLNEISAGPNWQSLYTTSNAANLLIKYVPAIDMQNEAKNNILAQAYAMRAYVYFVLARTWGGVPIRTSPTEGYNYESTQKPRSSVDEVFALIKDDLEKAISLFPNNTFPAGRNRWSRAAANAMKAEVYLWTGKRLNGGNADFNIALQACNEVEKADVSLLPNFADLFEFKNKGNKEVIMAVGFNPMEPSSPNNYFVDMYSGKLPTSTDPINGEIITQSGSGVWTVTPLIMNQFNNDDLRKAPSFVAGTPQQQTLIRKGRGTVINGLRYFSSDIILYRYADVLLMKAEAKNVLGQDPSGEINLIRKRAYGAQYSKYVFVNGAKVQNDDIILKERLLELVFEGKRWWDLVRFGKAFDIVPSLAVKAGQNHYLLWPVGLEVLSLEPEVIQTNGW